MLKVIPLSSLICGCFATAQAACPTHLAGKYSVTGNYIGGNSLTAAGGSGGAGAPLSALAGAGGNGGVGATGGNGGMGGVGAVNVDPSTGGFIYTPTSTQQSVTGAVQMEPGHPAGGNGGNGGAGGVGTQSSVLKSSIVSTNKLEARQVSQSAKVETQISLLKGWKISAPNSEVTELSQNTPIWNLDFDSKTCTGTLNTVATQQGASTAAGTLVADDNGKHVRIVAPANDNAGLAVYELFKQ